MAADPPPQAIPAVESFEFKPELPTDVEDGSGNFAFVHDPDHIPEAQRLFDRFAWKMFVGMNWPTNAEGLPDPNINLQQDAREGSWRPRVWQALAEVNQLFRQYGAAPEPWKGAAYPGSFVPGQYEPLTLWMYSKINNRHAVNRTQVLDESKQAFSGPLVDQNGKWARYQVRVNRTSYEYVRQNKLSSLEGQAAFSATDSVLFPRDGDSLSGETFRYGTTEVKLAWKQIGDFDPAREAVHPGDFDLTRAKGFDELGGRVTWSSDPSRFLVRWSRVIHSDAPLDQNGSPTVDPLPRPFGLVGMHISVKTVSSPQWIWATFEHIDNVETDDLAFVNVGGQRRRLRPNFNNPALPTKVPNLLPEKNSKLDASGHFTDWDESKTTSPAQVTRVIPIPKATQRVNRAAREALSRDGSVLRFYELVGVQWPVSPKAPAFPSGSGSAPESIVFKTPGRMVPVYLVNTTMETFFQKGVQPAGPLAQDDRLPPNNTADATPVFGTESCVGCHYSAGMCLGFKRDAEGNFIFNEGNKVPIFGINSSGGRTGNADFSWLLQMKAQSVEVPKETRPAPGQASLNDPGTDPEKNVAKALPIAGPRK